MILDFAVIADYALVDQAGKLSVLGIFQHIWVQQFPATHPRLHLVLRLKGRRTEVGEHTVQIRLLDEQDAEILGGNGNVTFAEPPAGVTEIEAGAILVFDVPFPHAGPYRSSRPSRPAGIEPYTTLRRQVVRDPFTPERPDDHSDAITT